MKVAVLGCGPAGLLAAFAAEEDGHDVTVLSQHVKSRISGAQYIGSPIPGLDVSEEEVHYVKLGTREGYAEKVYGDKEAPVSWDTFPEGPVAAYRMETVYDMLWSLYYDRIGNVELNSAMIPSICEQNDVVLSTVPAPALCYSIPRHEFYSATIQVAEAPIVGVRNLIVYSGRPEDQWYRASNLFGHPSVEFGPSSHYRNGDAPVYVSGYTKGHELRKGIKPTRTECDCHLHIPNYHRLGRFGRWVKGVLVIDAFNDAKRIAEEAVANAVH